MVDDIIKIEESHSIYGRCMDLQDLQSKFVNIGEAISQCGLRIEGWLIKRKCSSQCESMCWELIHMKTGTQSLNN